MLNPKKQTNPRRINPATQRQLDYIADMGGQPTPGMTVQDASDMIRRLKADPRVVEMSHQRWLEREKREEREERKFNKYPAFYLHLAVDEEKRLLSECEPEEMEYRKSEIEDTEKCRVEQWLMMFTGEEAESIEGRKFARYALDFNTPEPEQVGFVLASLDKDFAHVTWERKEGASFFTRLELLYPQLRKRPEANPSQ